MTDTQNHPCLPQGIVTVLNTPFTAAGGIHVDGLRANVRAAIDAGVAGFLVPAKASEVLALTPPERETLVRTVVEASDGKLPVIVGTEAETREERLACVARAVTSGCHAVLLCIPFNNTADFEDEVRAAADLGPECLVIQDWDPTGAGLPVSFIARLFENVPAFRGLKVEVVPAGPKYTAVFDATQGRLHVSGGWAVTQMIEALDRGVHAFMPTGMHRAYVEIYRRYHAGDRPGARALFERLLPIIAFSNQHLDISIHFFKRLLHAQGIYETPNVRAPQWTFDAHHERIAHALIERAIALEAELGGR